MSNMSNLDILCSELNIAEPTMEQVRLVAVMEHINHLMKLYANLQWKDLTMGVPDLPSQSTDTELWKVYNGHRPTINKSIPASTPWLPVCRPRLEADKPHLLLPYGYELILEDKGNVNVVNTILFPNTLSESVLCEENILVSADSIEKCMYEYVVECARLRFEFVESQRESMLYAVENYNLTKEEEAEEAARRG